jgi:hypothetical protein
MRIAVRLCAALILAVVAVAEPLTTGTLVSQMTDMFRLAEFPEPFYKTVQFSSYDHRSTVPGGPEWFANSDGFGQEPVPNFEAVLAEPGANGIGEYLVCDVKGPGAIVRVWTARSEGTIKVFFDGDNSPVFDGAAEEFFMHPWTRYAEAAGLDLDVLNGAFYQRNAAYCPMPFAKRCRITWTGDVNKIHFYQIQVRLYQSDRDVTTFKPGDLKTYADDIQHAAEVLKDPQTRWPYRSSDSPRAIKASVEPGARAEALKLEGPGTIERLTLRVTADDLDAALRQTILNIRFDDYPSSQVQSPIGDFFGAAPGVNPYDSVPFSVAADGTMTCRYVMPFAKNATIFFENLGTQAVTVQGEAFSGEYAWDAERSMHFRARWRIDHGLTASGAEPHDIPFLVANGAGVYVGSVTYVLNPNDVPSPGGNWWGEGDEKIFVDSDVRPSTFGTGSEDYYNYAWSSPDIFVYPYCGQPRNDGPANRGFVANNRWHIVDDLPFDNRIAFYMELFPHELNHGMAYGRIGYHYGRPGIMDDHIVITPEDVRNQVLPPWMPAARGAASNAVFYQAEQVDAPRDDVILEAGNLWAGGNIYRWYPKNVGDTIAFTVPFKEGGKYAIQAVLAHDKKSGKVTMLFDDTECGTWDLYDASREMLRAMSGGDHEVAAGDHTIAFRFDGGEKSLGVDFFWIQKR